VVPAPAWSGTAMLAAFNRAGDSDTMPSHIMFHWGALVMLAIGLVSCQLPDRFLIHPHEGPPQVQTWAEEVDTGLLRLRLIWAKPAGPGPFPTVLVHPDGGATAADMRGVLWDLASRGYLAVAADYRRRRGDVYRRTLVPWCEEADSTAVLDVLRAQPWVDPHRVGALGFSQGGIFSLLLAAQAAEIKAVVAYYPVTDLPQWLAAPRAPLLKRVVFSLIRAYFQSEAAACPQEPWQGVLQQASPLYQAERMQAPVLLLHGDQDGAAPVAESRRLAARLAALGREVALVVIEGGRHVFNFKHPAQAQYAWQITLQWLARHLGPGTSRPVRAHDPHARIPVCSQQ
jgi:dienelactone hydrolase